MHKHENLIYCVREKQQVIKVVHLNLITAFSNYFISVN